LEKNRCWVDWTSWWSKLTILVLRLKGPFKILQM
jgi:hypothetical protein